MAFGRIVWQSISSTRKSSAFSKGKICPFMFSPSLSSHDYCLDESWNSRSTYCSLWKIERVPTGDPLWNSEAGEQGKIVIWGICYSEDIMDPWYTKSIRQLKVIRASFPFFLRTHHKGWSLTYSLWILWHLLLWDPGMLTSWLDHRRCIVIHYVPVTKHDFSRARRGTRKGSVWRWV